MDSNADQNRRYADEVALMSGAAAAVGRATARAFARESVSVVIVDVDEQAKERDGGKDRDSRRTGQSGRTG
jgi:NAD(P)-dependent dehydrogenase (short-subunit alcohol dehydrogenase family)